MITLGNWFVDFNHPALIILTAMLIISCIFSLRAIANRLFHRSRIRAILAMALNLLAFSALLVLFMQPVKKHQAEETVTLLTGGFDDDALVFSAGADIYLYSKAEPNKALNLPDNIITLSHIAQLNLKEPALTKVQVKGAGLSETDWNNFSTDIEVEFQAPFMPGFVDVQWRRSLSVGETFTVNGVYQSADPDSVVDIQLLDPAGSVVDSTRIAGSNSFKQSARPKVRGNIKYSIQALKTDAVQARQIVPVSVQGSAPITIMIQQSAPSFETRQLKDYASVLGHRVLINTIVSKDKTITQKSNLSEITDTGLSPQTLAMADVLIMDGRALNALDGKARRWLQDAITNGLGLLVMADSSLLETPPELQDGVLSGFELKPEPDIEPESIPRLLSDKSTIWQSPLPTRALSLNGSDADSLIDDGLGRSLVSIHATGLGYVAVNLITQSNQWITSGNRADWGTLWSSLLEAIARQSENKQLLAQADTSFYRPNQKTAVCALGVEDLMRVSITTTGPGGALDLDMSKDALQSDRQCAFFWPNTDGWHKIELMAEDTGELLDQDSIYVFQHEQWKTQSHYNRSRATIVRAKKTHTKQGARQKWVAEPIGLFWPWLIFVITASLLWLERKVDRSHPRRIDAG